MPKFINSHLLINLQNTRNNFVNAKPFKHVVIDNFLEHELAENLLKEFPTVSDPSKLLNEFGTPNPKSAISDIQSLTHSYILLDELIQTKEFLDLISNITDIPDLCYDPWYFGAGTHENFNGAGLDAHYDFNIHPKTGYHRRVNVILYLNKDWKPDWNGEISFHTDPWDLKNDVKKPVQPEFNRCVIFETTENSWHSVNPINLPQDLQHISRKSFTIYLYSKTRPLYELAVEHGTVYVPPPLSPRIRDGHVLNANDVAELENNIFRRHSYLRSLYKREYDYSSQIGELKNHIEILHKKSYVPILGYVKLINVDRPLFSDGWMGECLIFTAETRSRISKIVMRVWRPDDVTDALNVKIEVNGHSVENPVGAGISELSIEQEFDLNQILQISVYSDATQTPGDADTRFLSFIVDSFWMS